MTEPNAYDDTDLLNYAIQTGIISLDTMLNDIADMEKKGNTCTACLRNYSNNRQIGKRNLFHVSSTTRRKPTLQTQKYP